MISPRESCAGLYIGCLCPVRLGGALSRPLISTFLSWIGPILFMRLALRHRVPVPHRLRQLSSTFDAKGVCPIHSSSSIGLDSLDHQGDRVHLALLCLHPESCVGVCQFEFFFFMVMFSGYV
ncbi:hypothetical protein P175DRAFT_0107606 [Aspergillus ochraceoroseus IBT 24754]|uniref:Uncharacterized protein n=1 Tax=Aspergillus ochraceoroseus IBT 24754 TaxID=1392256 RepID=A0A2T5LM42_9EURO|nr:uncharacterized protein P175DRAFT_0107606 [Aspergillus ochraceoroseus IBT 24754]PTU17345.1 hypothetical protein P175DRAFT_0107606 [Aspergillus ochraceoroseus IBT 24754]